MPKPLCDMIRLVTRDIMHFKRAIMATKYNSAYAGFFNGPYTIFTWTRMSYS
jgi:hypothetical protein